MKDNKLEIGDALYYQVGDDTQHLKKITVNRVTTHYAYAHTMEHGQEFEMRLCIGVTSNGKVRQPLAREIICVETEKLKADYLFPQLRNRIKSGFSEAHLEKMSLEQLTELNKWLDLQPPETEKE